MTLSPDQWMLTALFVVSGMVLGSFGNVIILRTPEGRSINGRSGCPDCKKTLGPLELIPVISFLFLMGRCSGCHRRISWQYPVIELVSGLLFAAALIPASFDLFSGLLLALCFWAMLLIAVIDARTGMIPDALTLVVILSAVGFRWWSDGHIGLEAPLIGAGFFGLQWIVSRGQWVGSGDILLAAGLGVLISDWQIMIMMLMLAYMAGALYAVVLLAMKRVSRGAHMAFGPFLVGSAFVCFLWGDEILNAVLP